MDGWVGGGREEESQTTREKNARKRRGMGKIVVVDRSGGGGGAGSLLLLFHRLAAKQTVFLFSFLFLRVGSKTIEEGSGCSDSSSSSHSSLFTSPP